MEENINHLKTELKLSILKFLVRHPNAESILPNLLDDVWDEITDELNRYRKNEEKYQKMIKLAK